MTLEAIGERDDRLVGPVAALEGHRKFSHSYVPGSDVPVGSPTGQHHVVLAEGEAQKRRIVRPAIQKGSYVVYEDFQGNFGPARRRLLSLAAAGG